MGDVGQVLRVTLVGAAMASLVACGGSGEPPEGHELLEGASYSVAVPEDWEIGQPENRAFRALSEPGSGEMRRQVSLQLDQEFEGSLDVAKETLHNLTGTTLDEFEVVAEQPLDVPGADEALRTEMTWAGTNDAGESVPMRAWNVYAVNGDGDLVALQINSADADFEREWVEPIVDSLEV